MKNVTLIFICLLLAVVAGCSSSNSDAPVVGGGGTGTSQQHPDTWIADHGAVATTDLRGCQGCHGFDFKGSGNAVSCFNCHSSGPPFTGAHPASWNADPLNSHQLNFQGTLSDKTPWTTCAVAACHGAKLEGGTAGPTCQNNTANCHTTGTSGWPPAPSSHTTYSPPSNGNHGLAAKGVTDSSKSMGNDCILCHGTPTNGLVTTFNGGFVSDPAILNVANGDCSSCHTTAKAHPGNWTSTRAANSVFHNDGNITTNPNIKSDSCALCHTTTGTSPSSPFTGAPTCFNADFNGLNCHASGPGGAPHAVPYTDPNDHGPAAKADPTATTGLLYCQICHATAGGAGSNPTFDVSIGSLTNGCEDCHVAGAHPTRSDRWTFNLDTNHDITGEVLTRRNHFATGGSINTACALCHNVNNTNVGSGTAPACNTCHTTITPSLTLDCTFCHLTPPDGAADLTGGTFVNHAVGTDVSTITNHEDCSICHGASENGSTGTLQAKSADYVLFAGTGQGGDHLDGLIETNLSTGYVDVTGVLAERFGCNNACHPNDGTHQLSDAGLGTQTGNYTTGTIACNDCHGYPPDGVTAAPGATPASHVGGTLGADLLAFHGECQTCHGTKDTAGAHDPLPNYVPATNHYNGLINMNSATAYNATNGGCDTAVCHGNDAAHRVPPTSGLTVQDGDYGTGSCSSCHAYPPDGVSAPLTAPVGTLPVNHLGSDSGATLLANHGDCQICHGTKDTAGVHDPVSPYVPATHHRDDQIQMNLDTGYNATNFGCDSAGCHANDAAHQLSNSNLTVDLLALGGAGACDTCHGGLPGDATPIASHAHTAHISSTTSVSMLCSTCHGHNGSGPTHNQGGLPVDPAFVDIVFTDIANSGAFTGSYSGTATKQCSNVYCHGAANTPDWDAGTGGACGDCHGDGNGRPDALNEPSGGSHLSTTHAASACTACHTHDGTTGTSISEHIDGPADVNGDALVSIDGADIITHSFGAELVASPDPDGYKYSASTCTANCHGSATWGQTGGCNFCHGYPPDSVNNSHAIGTTAVNHDFLRDGTTNIGTGLFDNHDECSYCHGVKDDGSSAMAPMATSVLGGTYTYIEGTDHQDGNVTMNGPSGTGAGYVPAAGSCDNAVCHTNDAAHSLSSGSAVQARDFGPGLCTSCHDGSGAAGTATSISDSSNHAFSTTFLNCEECHTAHGSGTIEIPNNPTVGINYSANGEGGIALGGSAAPGATEAEICWNCHDNHSQSEWGVNNNVNTGSMTYDYGSLDTSNWTTATWTSANFAYKTGRIQSTHSVNSAGSSAVSGTLNAYTESPDNVALIRCSYCHDVHDLNTLASDNSSGKPYLRGTWMGNPYKEDGAPQSGTNYTDNSSWGQVPRASAASNMQMGGYWIDANSGNPTSGWSLTTSAGLCTVCHGTDVDNMDQLTGENLWVGTNGHANAAIGGTGTGRTNIFDARGGTSAYSDRPLQHFQGMTDPADNGSWGFRSENSNANQWTPLLSGGTRPRKMNSDEWGVDETGGTNQSQYHKFSCSKCHNPHASRLPKLLITNCLDTKHNTWDDSYQLASSADINTNRSISNWSSAQNCHRMGGIADGTGPEPIDPGAVAAPDAGWNKVTPWRVSP